MHIINNFLFILFLDTFSIGLTKIITDNPIVSPNSRWFLIHSISNLYIAYYAFWDLKECIESPVKLYNIKWDVNSFNIYQYTMLLHLYHCLFFKLTKSDILHHCLMCGISGSLEFYNTNKLCSAALFFLSGLPGSIDYFLLYLVKINKLSKITEKKAYIFISTWIRSPGCCLITFLGIRDLIDLYYINTKQFYLTLPSVILTFWNGQYYMMRTCIDYGVWNTQNNLKNIK